MGIYGHEVLGGYVISCCQIEIEEKKEGECNDFGHFKNIKLRCEAVTPERYINHYLLLFHWFSSIKMLTQIIRRYRRPIKDKALLVQDN